LASINGRVTAAAKMAFASLSIMKQASILLATRYVAALTKHLQGNIEATTEPALRWGQHTLASGLKTLDLARIHDQAMLAMSLSSSSPKNRRALSKRAAAFFAQASAAIEEAHRPAGRRELDWQEVHAALGRRTGELAAVKVQLRQDIAKRKLIENAHRKRGKLHHKCLEESLQLQKRLRQLTHRLFAAQESERQKIGRELENEIAQTLLAIHVRLLTLKKEAWTSTEAFKENLAGTQRLLMESVQTVRQVVARKVSKP
jgi:signal transduction histidine kinase